MFRTVFNKQVEIFLIFSKLVSICDDFFRRLQGSLFSTIDSIVISFLKAGIVIEFSVFVRNGFVFLFDTRLHLIVQFFPQGFCMGRHRVQVLVFCRQVIDYGRILAFLQPVVFINAFVSMLGDQFKRLLLGNGRFYIGSFGGFFSFG